MVRCWWETTGNLGAETISAQKILPVLGLLLWGNATLSPPPNPAKCREGPGNSEEGEGARQRRCRRKGQTFTRGRTSCLRSHEGRAKGP